MERVAGALMLVLLVAPMLGSFAGALVDRLPAGRPLAFDRSRCACGRTLGPGELIPVVSFLLQLGRCRGCGQPIPRQTLAIELAAITIAALALAWTGEPVDAALGTVLGLALMVLAL